MRCLRAIIGLQRGELRFNVAHCVSDFKNDVDVTDDREPHRKAGGWTWA